MSIDRQYFGQFPFDARGDQQVLRWAATRQAQSWGLQVGYEHKRAAENAGDGLAVRSADGAFAIGRWTPDNRFSATLSLRRDDNQGYQGQTTTRISAAYQLGGGFSVLGSAGQGFKTPSLYETTYPCFECATPGPAKGLKAELAVGEDAALDWRSTGGAFTARLTGFGLNVTDQIDYIYPQGYLNLSKVSSAGLEASGQARLGAGFTLRGSFAYIGATNGSSTAQLLRIPRDSGSGSLDWQGGKARVEVGFRGQDQAADVAGELKPFLIGYATASYDLSRHLRVSARIEDVANTHYETAFGYGEPGRMALVGLSWR
jgi:vitamin B12 transporter